MSLKKKIISFLFIFALLVSSLLIFSYAESGSADKLYEKEGELLIISYRGDISEGEKNSLPAIKSAFEKGADFVSTELEKADGKYFLSDKTTLEKLLKSVPEGKALIIDVPFSEKEDIYNVLISLDGLDKAFLRMEKSGNDIAEWALSKENKPNVIGVYSGNLIFSTVSNINALTKYCTAAVQYQSKNYFNVAFGEFFTNRYLTKTNVRAIAAAYDKDLCGQRTDGNEGWDELIEKGYSVIETNNTSLAIAYRNNISKGKEEISSLLQKAKSVNFSEYSSVSRDNLNKALNECERVLSKGASSLNEVQNAKSALIFALNSMEKSQGEVQTKGALNITAGKVVASALVGIGILLSQIYFYKMRKKKTI